MFVETLMDITTKYTKEELVNLLSTFDKQTVLNLFDKMINKCDHCCFTEEEEMLIKEAKLDYKNGFFIEEAN
jgi:hypothetical protein